MVSRLRRERNKNWHKEKISNKIAIGLVLGFFVLVSLFIFANFRKAAILAPVNTNPAASILKRTADSLLLEKNQLMPFSSEDEFKSYLDDGKRAYRSGIFEEQTLISQKRDSTAAQNPAITNTKTNAPKLKAEDPAAISGSDALKYFSLGAEFAQGDPDILQTGAKNIFFSQEKQVYSSAGDAGASRVIETYPAEALSQTGAIPAAGDLLLSNRSLFVLKNNTVSAFDVSESPAGNELWKARINEGTQVIGAKADGAKMYLILKTAIDAAHPCPIKPVESRDKPLIIGCEKIYHPKDPVLADSIFSVLEIDQRSGIASQNISFAGNAESSNAIISQDMIYAIWGKGGDYISFFVDFLNDRCGGILPQYLLEKASGLPRYPISLAAKELELRALISNWTGSLDSVEQARVSDELASRLADYLRSHSREFEQTEVAAASLKDFRYTAQAEIPGALIGSGSVDESNGKLRLATISGKSVLRKASWLITGKTVGNDSQNAVSNIYVLDGKLKIQASQEGLDLQTGICAISFSEKNALASICIQNNGFYTIGLSDSSSFGLKGEIKPELMPSYVRFLTDDLVLAVSNNNRKIKISLFDISLPSKPELKSVYGLNDYWADLESNYRAFSMNGENKQFFLPSDHGGTVFSYEGGAISLKKAVGNIAASRSFFSRGSLYLVGDSGVEVFGSDFDAIKSIIF